MRKKIFKKVVKIYMQRGGSIQESTRAGDCSGFSNGRKLFLTPTLYRRKRMGVVTKETDNWRRDWTWISLLVGEGRHSQTPVHVEEALSSLLFSSKFPMWSDQIKYWWQDLLPREFNYLWQWTENGSREFIRPSPTQMISLSDVKKTYQNGRRGGLYTSQEHSGRM